MRTLNFIRASMLVACSFLLLTAEGCTNSPKAIPMRTSDHSHLPLTLNGQTPVERFSSDARNAKLHFLAVVGYALYVPGVERYSELYSQRVPVEIINEGTDSFHSEKERTGYDRAIDFAEAYNLIVLRHLGKGSKGADE